MRYDPSFPAFVPAGDLVRRAIRRERCRRSLWHFVRETWDVLEPGTAFRDNWHIGAICEHLEAVTDRIIPKLVINIPPGMMKSLLASVFWIAWEWGFRPTERTMCGSYDEALVFRDSDRCRDLLKSRRYYEIFEPDWEIKNNQDSKRYFVNTVHGSRRSFFMGGKSKTGWRGDKIVLDDPISGDARYNRAVKDHAWDVVTKILPSRVNDPENSAFVVMAQRLADDDVPGRIMEHLADQWEFLVLPARYVPRSSFSGPVGKLPEETSIGFRDPRSLPEPPPGVDPILLHPGLLTENALIDLEKTMLPSEFVGQYQQDPIPAAGNRFNRDWFRYWRRHRNPDGSVAPNLAWLGNPSGEPRLVRLDSCWSFVSCDLAASESERGDWTVFLRWAVTEDSRMFLLRRFKAKVEEPECVDMAVSWYESPSECGRRDTFWAVPSGGLGRPIAQAMERRGIPVVYVTEYKDKFTRSTTAAVRTAAGMVYFPDPSDEPWEIDFESAVVRFPGGSSDDDADAFSIGAEAVFVGVVGGILSSESVKAGKNGLKFRGFHHT